MSSEKQEFTVEEADIDRHIDDIGKIEDLPVFQRVTIDEGGKLGVKENVPITVIVVGMAGAGKSTLMQALYDNSTSVNHDSDSGETSLKCENYFINLDPATRNVSYGASIDIRDTIDYKECMKSHNLGPNGAIMTSLNLFATKFDQVLRILDTKTDYKHIIVDTPGQIEAFTWSASGTIMSEALASSFPTVLAFVVDTPRCAASPATFMSNMLYACSMMYRTRLPIVIVFNKIDVVPHDFCEEWMSDFEAFHEAVDNDTSHGDGGYYSSLTRSLSLMLDEFYCNLHRCGVSAVTGDGLDSFWDTISMASRDFAEEYLPDLRNRIEEVNSKKVAKSRKEMQKFQNDT